MVDEYVVNEYVVTELPGAVRAYLSAATRHLPRRARADVSAELHANLHQRMLDHSLMLDTPAAWSAALRDFGPPQTTARALVRVHRWPGLPRLRLPRLRLPRLTLTRLTLVRAGLAALALGGAGYAAARSLGWPAEAPQSQQAR